MHDTHHYVASDVGSKRRRRWRGGHPDRTDSYEGALHAGRRGDRDDRERGRARGTGAPVNWAGVKQTTGREHTLMVSVPTLDIDVAIYIYYYLLPKQQMPKLR